MRRLFYGDCFGCRRFTPRCAWVYLTKVGRAAGYVIKQRVVLCSQCRYSLDFNGKYTLDDQHK